MKLLCVTVANYLYNYPYKYLPLIGLGVDSCLLCEIHVIPRALVPQIHLLFITSRLVSREFLGVALSRDLSGGLPHPGGLSLCELRVPQPSIAKALGRIG